MRGISWALAISWVFAGAVESAGATASAPGDGGGAIAAGANAAAMPLLAPVVQNPPVVQDDPETPGRISCSETIDCGIDCEAKLAHGWCADIIEVGFTIPFTGITVKLECTVCECWYYVDRGFGKKLERKARKKCGAEIRGLRLY